MFIARKSMSSGKIRTIDVPVTPEQLEAWEEGEPIEKAFPKLSLAHREYIMSGLTPSEFTEVFGVTDNSFGRTIKELEAV